MSQPASDGATQGVVGQVGDEHVPGHVGDQQRRAGIADHDLGGDPTRPERLADAAARRPADAVAVLDELEVEREHFIGTSWAAGLGFAIGQHASDRPSVASVPVASYDSGGALPPWLSVAYNGTRAPPEPVGGIGDVSVQVFVGDREITDIVDVRLDDRARRGRRLARNGG